MAISLTKQAEDKMHSRCSRCNNELRYVLPSMHAAMYNKSKCEKKQLLWYDWYGPVLQITWAIHDVTDIGCWGNISNLKALNVQLSHAAEKSCLSAITVSACHNKYTPLHLTHPSKIIIIILPSVCLCVLTLYPATDCVAVTDISSVSGHWQLSH